MTAAYLTLVSLATGACIAAAEMPKLLPFQGVLSDSQGSRILDGSKVVQFKIYDAPVGGQTVWNGEVQRLTVNNGTVSTVLGTRSSLESVDLNGVLYLEITVDSNDDEQITVADPPLLPRQSLIPVIFSKEAANSRFLNGHDWSVLFDSENPLTGTIMESKLRDGSITAQKIRSETITAAQISPDAITSTRIAAGAVGRDQLAEGAVQSRHLGDIRIPELADSSGTLFGLLNEGWLHSDRGITASGPAYGRFAFSGGFDDGALNSWLDTQRDDVRVLRLIGNTPSSGFGIAAGNSVASPLIWLNRFSGNALEVRAVGDNGDVAQGEALFRVHSTKHSEFLGSLWVEGPRRRTPGDDKALVVRQNSDTGDPNNTVFEAIGGPLSPEHQKKFRIFTDNNDPWNLKCTMDGSIKATGSIQANVAISSDRNLKTDFAPVNKQEILSRLLDLPISYWRFTNEVSEVRHLGPTAQDFGAQFKVGSDDKYIGAVDANGVALVSIQALHEKIADQEQRIRELEKIVLHLHQTFQNNREK